MGCMIVVVAQFLERSGVSTPVSLPIWGFLVAWEAFLTYPEPGLYSVLTGG